jgi:Protein of unknown function (DUF2946)
MIFSKKLFRWVHKIALFAIVFASLAPSISHALAAKQEVNSFSQEICASDGQTITIQVVTSKGRQLATELAAEEAGKQTPPNIVHHLKHCPFCANPAVDTTLEAPHAFVVALLATQAKNLAVSSQSVLPCFSVLPPPAQAPPYL